MPRSAPSDFDITTLHQYLKDSVRRGARAARLVEHVPEIIELLYPAADHPHLSQHTRAIQVEADIRHAVDNDIGGAPGEALAAILCLRPGTVGRTLEDRRQIAGNYFHLQGGTFRRDRHEGALLLDLAIELLRQRLTPHTQTTPENTP
jgi:hypothetical protein